MLASSGFWGQFSVRFWFQFNVTGPQVQITAGTGTWLAPCTHPPAIGWCNKPLRKLDYHSNLHGQLWHKFKLFFYFCQKIWKQFSHVIKNSKILDLWHKSNPGLVQMSTLVVPTLNHKDNKENSKVELEFKI